MSDPIDYNDHVTITRANGDSNASFNTIACFQSDMVFWKNEDSEAHSPTFSTGNPPPALTYQAGPHATSDQIHPFHIHINPFQILEVTYPDAIGNLVTYKPQGPPVWSDVVNIPVGGSVKIRQAFYDFTGTTCCTATSWRTKTGA
jgi:hypothetical protein